MRQLDTETCTDAQVDMAYGGTGWRTPLACLACGASPDRLAVFPSEVTAICHPCAIAAAAICEEPTALAPEPAPAQNLIQRFKTAIGLTSKGASDGNQ
jgi:hypothetical protein